MACDGNVLESLLQPPPPVTKFAPVKCPAQTISRIVGVAILLLLVAWLCFVDIPPAAPHTLLAWGHPSRGPSLATPVHRGTGLGTTRSPRDARKHFARHPWGADHSVPPRHRITQSGGTIVQLPPTSSPIAASGSGLLLFAVLVLAWKRRHASPVEALSSSEAVAEPSRHPVILGFGEALFDCLPSGPVLGGAPLNFAIHAKALGANVHMWTCVGRDADGDRCRNVLTEFGVGTSLVQTDGTHRTGYVEVELSASGEPTYTIHEDVAYDYLKWTPEARALTTAADGICFGSMSQRSEGNREVLRRVWAESGAFRLFDINLRPPFIDWTWIEEGMRACDGLKLNAEEWVEVVRRFLPEAPGAAGETALPALGDVQAQAQALLQKFDLKWIVLTRGAEGTVLVTPEDIFVGAPVQKKDGGDAVGAGDACAATMFVGLLLGMPPQSVVDKANKVGAFVASQRGATPRLPDTLLGWDDCTP